MINEYNLINSLIKHNIEKESIKNILVDIKDEIEWDNELIEFFADNSILDIAFEILDKNTIIDILSSGEINVHSYIEDGFIPISMSLQPGIFDDINNGNTIYNIFKNLGIDIEKSDNYGGYESCLCTDYFSDIVINFLGGIEIVQQLLDTYGHLNNWYKSSYCNNNTLWYYRNKDQVEGFYKAADIYTIKDFLNSDNNDTNKQNEILNFLTNKFSKSYTIADRLSADEFVALALEEHDMYQL